MSQVGSAFAPMKKDDSKPSDRSKEEDANSSKTETSEKDESRKVSFGRAPMESEDAMKSRRQSLKDRTSSTRRATKTARVESFMSENKVERQASQDKARGEEKEGLEEEGFESKKQVAPKKPTPSSLAAKPTVASLSRLLAIAETQRDDALKREGELKARELALTSELAAERERARKYYESVDARNGALIEGVTHHMARSHHTAMQTIQSAQEMNNLVVTSAIGRSLHRLKHSGARIAALLPPEVVAEVDKESTGAEPSTKKYHAQVASFLTEKVKDLSKGQELLKDLDGAIAEGQKSIDQERATLKSSPSSKDVKEQGEMKTLSDSLERQERALGALIYERAMLAAGLERVAPSSTAPMPSNPTIAPSTSAGPLSSSSVPLTSAPQVPSTPSILKSSAAVASAPSVPSSSAPILTPAVSTAAKPPLLYSQPTIVPVPSRK